MKEFIKENRTKILASLFIIVTGVILYANTIHAGFIWDDYYLIENDPHIKSPVNALLVFTQEVGQGGGAKYGFYRPVATLSFMADYLVWGLNPAGYHTTNILIHIMTALMIMLVVYQLSKNGVTALMTAMLFVAHPVNTEAVSYISGRSDPLAALFLLVSLHFYFRQIESRKNNFYIISLLCFITALFCRASVITFPFVLMAYHSIFRKTFTKGKILGFVSAALIFAIYRVFFFTSGVNSVPTPALRVRLPGVFVAFTQYLRLLLLPVNLHMGYGKQLFFIEDHRVFIGAVVLAGAMIFIIKNKRRAPLPAFGALWFLVMLMPVSNIYPLNAYMAEHWLYFPSIGFLIFAVCGIDHILKKKNSLRTGLILLVFICFAYLTVVQNRLWANPELLYLNILKFSPRYYEANANLAKLYKRSKDYEQAMRYYRAAEKCSITNEARARQYMNMSNLLTIEGRSGEAIKYAEKAIELNKKKEYVDRLEKFRLRSGKK